MLILEKVKNTIHKYALIKAHDKVLVGVSGGPDSVVLLYLLHSLKRQLKIELHIVHLDHMLRKNSHRDREFVEKLARHLNIPVTTARIDVKRLAKRGSLEETARNARLNFFFQVAKKIKANKIALGHNFDDQAETVLMRILRGTGLYGLAGILPQREIAGNTLIRPLLEVRRKEIEAFLHQNKIETRLDVTNLEDIYLRNKIRNKLLPLLEKEYNLNIKEVLANLAESSAFDYDYLSQSAKRAWRHLGLKLNLKPFLKLHPAIQRLILRLSIAKASGSTRRITHQHIREIEDLICNRPTNSIVDLPKGVSIVKRKSYLYCSKR